MPIISLVTFVLGLTENVGLLALFCTDASLRTPFTVYLMNLLLANATLISFQYSMDIVVNYHQGTWTMSEQACTFYLYAVNILEGIW